MQIVKIKSLVHSVINLVNEYSGNYELLSMSCRILINLSDIPRLQPHFLQEPQITVKKKNEDTSYEAYYKWSGEYSEIKIIDWEKINNDNTKENKDKEIYKRN